MFPLKILGYILLLLGLGIIFYSLFISYNIFTGRALAPEVFEINPQPASNTAGKNPDLLTESKNGTKKIELTEEELKKTVELNLKDQLQSALPANLLPKLMNMICWSILAGIFIFGGAQVSGVGINLLKK